MDYHLFKIILLSVVLSACANPEDKILHNIHILFRHGDRSWIVPLPSAPNSAKLFDNGTAQLTDIGIVEEFNLGKWTREKYPDLVGFNFSRCQFHMRSTDLDRTLMSAESFIAGFYKGAYTPLYKFNVTELPIGIHTRPQDNDYMFHPIHCPRLERLQAEVLNSHESLQYEKENAELFDMLSKESGLSEPINRDNIWKIDDSLICMKSHDMKLPDWATEKKCKEIHEVRSHFWWEKLTSTDEILRLEVGMFLQMMVDHFQAIVDDSAVPELKEQKHDRIPQVMAYSAHDTNLGYMLGALTSYRKDLPPYSAAFIIELWGPSVTKHSLNDFYVRLRYKNGYKDSEGVYLNYLGTGEYSAEEGCPLNVFIETINELLMKPEDRENACRVEKMYGSGIQHTERTKWLAVVVVLSVIILISIIFTTITYFYLFHVRNSNYKIALDVKRDICKCQYQSEKRIREYYEV